MLTLVDDLCLQGPEISGDAGLGGMMVQNICCGIVALFLLKCWFFFLFYLSLYTQ